MKSDSPLDYAIFQLSPKRSRCELLVSRDGNTEKLASGLLKPFVSHLKFVEEQVAISVQSIKLEVGRCKNADSWFTKGTLERFVRFVSDPEILELANTFDAEMSQLESARRIYSQGAEDQHSGTGGSGSDIPAAADATKKELLRAIDVRLVAVQQDLTTAFTRAVAAGFNAESVSELLKFADRFGAQYLNEACFKFISLCERRPDLINAWKACPQDRTVRSSYGSDMSIDEAEEASSPDCPAPTGSHHVLGHHDHSAARGHPEEAGATQTRLRQQQQHQSPHNLVQSKPSAFQQQHHKFSFSSLHNSRESSAEPDDPPCRQIEAIVEKEKNQENRSNTTSSIDQTESTTIQSGQPARRLSVQDRINLFENKQKENSGSGGKPVVTKSVELRRLSSDVSSAPSAVEKAVLRRWSGASDMSIDLSGERKDIESPRCTPSSSSVSQIKSEDKKDTASSGKPESRIVPGRLDDSGSKNKAEPQLSSGREEVAGAKQLTVYSDKSKEAFESEKSNSKSGIVESDGWKDQTVQTREKTQSRSLLNRVETNNSNDQANSGAELRPVPAGKTEQGASICQPKEKGLETRNELARTKEQVVSEAQVAGKRDKTVPRLQVGAFMSKGSDIRSSFNLHQPDQIELPSQKEEIGLGDQLSSRTHFRAAMRSVGDSTPPEGSSGSRIREAFASQYRGIEGNSSSSQPKLQSFVETEEVQKKAAGEKFSGGSAVKSEHSGPQKMKSEKQITASEQIRNAQGPRYDSDSFYANNTIMFSTKTVAENEQGFNSFSTLSTEHAQRVRLSKGNQDLNDELKMKASELEKLFAEHKLRAPGEQSNSTRRSRPIDRVSEPPSSFFCRKPLADSAPSHLPDNIPLAEPAGSSKNMAIYNEVTPVKMVDNQVYSDSLNKNFSELSLLEASRGKFYERYMQKREAKLREEWGSKGAEKEAKLKAMQDTLERSRAEMNANFSGLTDSQSSVSSSQRRAERLRSFNSRSIMRREQQQLDFGQTDDDEAVSNFPQQKDYGEDGSLNEKSFMDSLPRGAQSKKLLPVKSLSSSTPRTPAAPVPRSAIRASNSSGRRRMQSENPVAQSVPNFSELRKENTKPYSVASKTTRPQMRNYARSKSTNEEMSFAKEEKSRRSQSLRKSSANLVEFRDMSTVDCEGDSLTISKFDKGGIDQSPYDKYSKNWSSKSFPKKESDVDFGARALQKTNMAAEPQNDGREYDDLPLGPEDAAHFGKDEEEEEFEKATTLRHSDLEDGEPELDHESEQGNFGLHNGVLRSFSHVDPSFVAELPAGVPPNFIPVENAQDSPGESPVSWNSRAHHPFSYSHEMSDIDASVDSPVGSPASWNSHSLSQTENDAARMRKKWGMAQKPMLVANSSQHQSRKDMTRGFKRLLKFGRKSRGTDSLVDWISATTSEGDDDTEDGRDPANRSSEDLRKSRMGSLQRHPSDDSFNDSEFFSEQVQSLRSSIPAPPANFKLREDHLSGSSIKAPRSSFFSLSSFRSKASDSKPR